PMRIPEIVGRRVREARKDIGLSQANLGERLGWYLDKPWFPQAVSEAEAGRRNFTAEELFALAIVVKRPLSWFFLPVSQSQTTFDLPLESFKPNQSEIEEGPLAGDGSVMAALIVEAQAIVTSMRHTSRAMEFRTAALIEMSQQLADLGEVTPGELERRDELASKRKAEEA
ncbi:MAG TPA: helix-turn-helix transcriptional regulator, partial [Actinomycetota bacterium]|nr:helix-turn-helix transcriptional regulator [Actinomycetota bacterium]